MKKSILLLSVLVLGSSLYAQQKQGRVGINTAEPKATLDISKGSVGDAKGLLIPRLTADEVKIMTDANKVSEDQNSLLLYVTAPFAKTRNKTGKYELIDQAGYYYYDAKDNGGKWKKLDTTLYGSNGTLSSDRTVTMNGKTLNFEGTERNKAKIQVQYMAERPASEAVFGIVMNSDGILKKDTNWWRLGDGRPRYKEINRVFLSNGGSLVFSDKTIEYRGELFCEGGTLSEKNNIALGKVMFDREKFGDFESLFDLSINQKELLLYVWNEGYNRHDPLILWASSVWIYDWMSSAGKVSSSSANEYALRTMSGGYGKAVNLEGDLSKTCKILRTTQFYPIAIRYK